MNSDIPLQTAGIFFSDELLSETLFTGYLLGVCHGWFNLHGLPLAARSESEIFKMKNSSCPQRDSNSRPLDCEAIAWTNRPRRPVLSPWLNLTRFSLCYLNLHDDTWQTVFSCIQYCTHITSVLFCGLNNNFIRVWIHRLSLCSPLYTDVSLTESKSSYLAYTFCIYWSQSIWSRCDFTHIFAIIELESTLFHTNLFTLSQIKYKIDTFHCFFLRSNWRNYFHADSTL